MTIMGRRAWQLASATCRVSLLAVTLLTATSARAHEGHDHGPPANAAQAPASPRLTATSENYQLVGIVEGEVLVIYLDRFEDNAPVTSAKLEVGIGEASLQAELQKNGTYEVTSPVLRQAGSHEVLVTITDGTINDLLAGSLRIPAPPGATSVFDHTVWEHVKDDLAHPAKVVGWVAGGILGFVGLGLLRQRRRGLGAIVLVLSGLSIGTATTWAHEGHDHGSPSNAATSNAPQRQPDGRIFLPKPSQRLLEIRTRIAMPETTTRVVRFIGRIVANPNHSGIVQSTIQGRFVPPPSGLQLLGTTVKAGDPMGSVAPSFISKDASDMTQTLGELDQQISLARTKLARQESLLRTNVVAQATVDETRIQLEGYLNRRKELLAARIAPEELRAPVDGVVTAVRVVPGQVVSQSDALFTIVDPASLMVEAFVFDQMNAGPIEDAVSTTGDNVRSRLRFSGRSRSLQQQYSVLKFDVLDPHPALNVGTPVTITGRSGEAVTGILLPRAAVAQAPNGQMVVFNHKEPEIFEPKAIRFEPFDAASILVLAGVEKGDKIVVEGAPLVNQVR